MSAPERFVEWLSNHRHTDPKLGHTYRYHPRSNVHSIELCTRIMDDLFERCSVLREQAHRGEVAYSIDLRHVWPTTGKSKTIDLAVGCPAHRALGPPSNGGIHQVKELSEVLIACEAKTVMTEHVKSQPRIFDELSSSHEIIHRGRQDAISAGITVVNIAETYISPTRQKSSHELEVTRHKQPHVTERMIKHLRGLQLRENIDEVGFDAYCTVVIDCDNQSDASLWTGHPAPQQGDPDHYDTFRGRIVRFYNERFSSLV